MMELDQKTLIMGVICLFVVGVGIGTLIAFYVIQTPLNEHYQEELARVTDNGRLKCFDLGNITFVGKPIVVDSTDWRAFCDYEDPMATPPITILPNFSR